MVRVRSDRDAGAALAPPGRQDRATGPGAHAQPEAVLLVATTVVRLECTLAHFEAPVLRSVRLVKARWLASRAASGPPQRGPTRACCAVLPAGTRHLRRCDSTSARYGQPGYPVKRGGAAVTGRTGERTCCGWGPQRLGSSGRADSFDVSTFRRRCPSPRTSRSRSAPVTGLQKPGDLPTPQQEPTVGVLHRVPHAYAQHVDNSVDNS